MVHLFFGENSYAIRQAVNELARAVRAQAGEQAVERFEGDQLESKELANILQGTTLFAAEKLVVITNASKNKALWVELEKYIEAMPEGTDLVLVETAPDRRTKTFKLLQKHATVKEERALSHAEAARWLVAAAKERGGVLSAKQATQLVELAGTDQWRLSNELDKLLAHGISNDAIEQLVEPTPQASVFALLDAALHRNRQAVVSQLATVKTAEDPYMLFGLLSTQVVQLAALVHGNGRLPEEIAKTLGVHPFPLKKLTPLARQTSPSELGGIIEVVATLDMQLKSTGLDPWLLMEQALSKIAARERQPGAVR